MSREECKEKLQAFSVSNLQNSMALLEVLSACEGVSSVSDALSTLKGMVPSNARGTMTAIRWIKISSAICPHCDTNMEAKAVNICRASEIEKCLDCKTWLHCEMCHHEVYSRKSILYYRR